MVIGGTVGRVDPLGAVVGGVVGAVVGGVVVGVVVGVGTAGMVGTTGSAGPGSGGVVGVVGMSGGAGTAGTGGTAGAPGTGGRPGVVGRPGVSVCVRPACEAPVRSPAVLGPGAGAGSCTWWMIAGIAKAAPAKAAGTTKARS
jgi:hypothetical protein